jgi:hypothetical protein
MLSIHLKENCSNPSMLLCASSCLGRPEFASFERRSTLPFRLCQPWVESAKGTGAPRAECRDWTASVRSERNHQGQEDARLLLVDFQERIAEIHYTAEEAELDHREHSTAGSMLGNRRLFLS